MGFAGFPSEQGLYDPRFEKDSCGIGFVAHLRGQKSHAIVSQALELLRNLHHRGAQGADPLTGDGAGILVQIPHALFSAAMCEQGIPLPEAGEYGVGMVFLPRDPQFRNRIEEAFVRASAREGVRILGWRDVPVRSEALGPQARLTEPVIRQVFIGAGSPDDFERKLYFIRKQVEREAACDEFHVASLSSATIVYKGLLLPHQMTGYFTDLADPAFESALGLVHSRFSTNTFPAWRLAHPYRYLCHNGEINTIQGNINWMKARQGSLHSEALGERITDLFPIVSEKQSDSASLDNALEFLLRGGRSLAHSMMMLMPEPWNEDSRMDPQRRAFYEYHSSLMEPWDGPAAVCFSDGRVIGATLDRNGLRPCRYTVTDDDRIILSSEAGVLPVSPRGVRRKGRLGPGQMLLVDTVQGVLLEDAEAKAPIASRQPYQEWLEQSQSELAEFPESEPAAATDAESRLRLQKAFGFTSEELKKVLAPMAGAAEEAISSMGNDTPLAVLSQRPQPLFKYFRQLFAQVTNPPIDPIREQLVMSLAVSLGARPNLLEETAESCCGIRLTQPILSAADIAKLKDGAGTGYAVRVLRALFRAQEGQGALERALEQLCREAADAVREGAELLILSDRGVDAEWAPIPSLLAAGAVHHHLIREQLRAKASLIVESGEPRDVHHFACLLGYGAEAVHPYLALESLGGLEGVDPAHAEGRFSKALNKGLLKIFSKMGISTLQSYCGAQIFEVIGLKREVVDRHFAGTPSRVEGIGLAEIAGETLCRHADAFSSEAGSRLDVGGEIHYRIQGERHHWNPDAIAKLQHATRSNSAATFREFSAIVDDANRHGMTLRGMLDFRAPPEPLAIDEVEPAAEIVKRFTTGAMSFGALGKEAHETLSVAMNRLGAKSNSGEGGEDPVRAKPLPNGDSLNSAIKQVASGRFGVTAHYLASARELQIKMAQGAKPGEGGQLPGHKVDETIARLRYSTPGVQLISPPPHHDIYSIEDLAQLIFDLKNANPEADVSVKLVSEAGVGTIAAGVVKAHADKVLISGDSGGTGASPLSSIKYAGAPWELGLAETHQTLVLNDLRSRVRIEVDGQLKTGRDVVVAALLGAEEFGFSTAPLIVQGCVMMRKCHLNTCPVGIATQDPELRKKFKGQPEHVINYFFFVAEEVRELMARLGYRRFSEMIGQADRLTPGRIPTTGKANGVDLSRLLFKAQGTPGEAIHWMRRQEHGIEDVLDQELLRICAPALQRREPVRHLCPIRNTNRSTGTLLSGRIAKLYGAQGLPDDTISIGFHGAAGQSFGAFLAPGITLSLEGEANDYVGKGLSGGKLAVFPPADASYVPEESALIGNTALYGATSGQAYFRGLAGERFAVRNSGARAVVEGVGDHGCEYMTGGVVVVLGRTGRNFAAGMSGGIAFVLDEDGSLDSRCNPEMVELGRVPDAASQEILRGMLTAHRDLTGSRKAREILKDWEQWLPRFVRVLPKEYGRVLMHQQKTQVSEVVNG